MTPVRIAPVCILVLFFCLPASAGVTQIQITSRTSFANGATFGAVGAYEVLQGTVSFAVNPSDAHNSVIFDINHAPLDSNGLVDFSANFFILKPVNMANSNHEILYDVNNRGGKLVLQLMDDVPGSANLNDPSTLADAGNQFLLLQGYTIVWVGWEGDLISGPNLLTAQLPVATQNGQPITGSILVEFFDTSATTLPLSGNTYIQSYPAISTNQTTAGAQLVMRSSDSPRPSGPDIPAGTVIPNSQWSFSNCSSPSTTNICYPAGFQTDMVYQLIYTATNPIIMGLGYATTRDFISFLRYGTQDSQGNPNPLAGDISFALAFGASQSGRYLRDYLYQGFNADEQGNQVFNGVFIHVAGANKLPLNYRFADADPYSLQHRQRYVPSDDFPRAYGVLTDPVTGTTDGILKRPSTDPKVFHTITSTEYWQYRDSLVDTDDLGTTDIANPSNVREFLLAGTAHVHAIDDTSEYGYCQQLTNVTINGGLLRALLLDLDQWVRNGTAPPPSAIPSIAAGTLVPSDQASTGFPSIPGVTYNGLFNGSGEENFGPDVSGNSGVVDSGYLDPIPLSTQQVLVPEVNSLGIDLGGIQEPTVAAPIDTLTGWNLRNSSFTDGDLCDLEGMTIPLQTTLADRLAAGDPRPSLQELYGDHTGYVNAITSSADSLEAQRFLLPQDVTQFIQNASNSSVLIPAPPPILLSLTPSQDTVSGGTAVTETANLSTVAPAGGATVLLSTSDTTLLSVPSSVTVPQGSYNATFTVNSTPVPSQTTATITGSYGGATQNASITVQAPALLALSLNPTIVTGGTSSQGTVTLSSPAPSGGTVVTLASNSTVATVPTSITVLAGLSSAIFTVNTISVSSSTTAAVTASYGGSFEDVSLTVQPPALLTLGLNPTTVTGGVSSQGTITLSSLAPAGGTVITLSSNSAIVTVPSSVTVLAGSSEATFVINTAPVSSETAVIITASYGGASQNSSITLQPPLLLALTLNPVTVTGGASVTGTVNLSSPAPSGGMVISLSSSNRALATVPSSVTVPANGTTANFTVMTSIVASTTTVTISATLGPTAKLGALQLTPPPSFTVTANPMVVSIAAPGQAGSTQLTLTSVNGFSGSTNLSSSSCSGLPAESTCSFVPSRVTLLSNGVATATLQITTTPPSASIRAGHLGPNSLTFGAVSIAFLIGMLVMTIQSRRQQQWGYVTLVTVFFLVWGAGCAGNYGTTGRANTNPGTPAPATSGVTVTITINGVTATVSNLTVTVH